MKDTTGFKGDMKAFRAFLRTDPRFNYSSAQEIIDNYKKKGAHAHELLPKFFSVVPKAKVSNSLNRNIIVSLQGVMIFFTSWEQNSRSQNFL